MAAEPKYIQGLGGLQAVGAAEATEAPAAGSDEDKAAAKADAAEKAYQEAKKRDPNHPHFLFVGNPGTGKSTLLNGLVGTEPATFESGWSPGSGKTQFLQKQYVEATNTTYMDTPGLEDTKIRELAAKQISEALKQGGNFKIFFVITLEAGRVRPADTTTMKVVLDAAPVIGSRYAVIINKVTKGALKAFAKDPENKNLVMASLFGEFESTSFVCFNPSNPSLLDEDNVVSKLPDVLQEFISSVQEVAIKTDEVKDIDASEKNITSVLEKMEKTMEDLKNNNKLLAKKIEELTIHAEEQKKELEANIAEQKKREEDLLKQLEEARAGTGGNAEELETQLEAARLKKQRDEKALETVKKNSDFTWWNPATWFG